MSKLNDYLETQKIDPRRILVASHELEALRPEDRSVRLLKKRAKAGDEKAKEQATKERRSGRPVSRPTLDRALTGSRPVSPAAKSRILRAVNAVLSKKKKGEVALRDLF